MLLGTFLFTLCTFLSPVAATWSPYALVALQIMKGIACVRLFLIYSMALDSGTLVPNQVHRLHHTSFFAEDRHASTFAIFAPVSGPRAWDCAARMQSGLMESVWRGPKGRFVSDGPIPVPPNALHVGIVLAWP